jgi:hypothetical protein
MLAAIDNRIKTACGRETLDLPKGAIAMTLTGSRHP